MKFDKYPLARRGWFEVLFMDWVFLLLIGIGLFILFGVWAEMLFDYLKSTHFIKEESLSHLPTFLGDFFRSFGI